MKYNFIILLIFSCLTIVAQSSKEYEFESQIDSVTSVKFSINFPESWHIINETNGTPYDLVGFELLGQNSVDRNECSPNMRIGISIFPENLDKTIESLGLVASNNGLYIFKDIDEYVNIIVLSNIESTNDKGVSFRIKKLSNCAIDDNKKRNKRKDRNTVGKSYVLFSKEDVTVCLESFNGEFTGNTMTLVESTFRFGN